MMNNKFKKDLYKASGISKSYNEIRESIDLDKYVDAKFEKTPNHKTRLMPKLFIGLGCACGAFALTIGTVAIIKMNSHVANNGYSLFYEYFDSFAEFSIQVEEYRQNDIHNLAPKPYNLFEINNTYGYKGSYVIEGICGCPFNDRDEAHKDGMCPTFDMNSPHYYFEDNAKLKDKLVDISYLQEIAYDHSSISWEELDGGTGSGYGYIVNPYTKYLLKDSDNNEVVLVSVHKDFGYKETLLNDLLNLLN